MHTDRHHVTLLTSGTCHTVKRSPVCTNLGPLLADTVGAFPMGECPGPRVCRALLPCDGKAASTGFRHARVIVAPTRFTNVFHAWTDSFRHWTLQTRRGTEETVKLVCTHTSTLNTTCGVYIHMMYNVRPHDYMLITTNRTLCIMKKVIQYHSNMYKYYKKVYSTEWTVTQ